MSDPKQRLKPAEVAAAGLADWRQLQAGIRARFTTGDFATGLVLVERIGAAAEAANHHPDVSLRYPEVIVTLLSHDVNGITSRDLDLASQISEIAAGLGIGADTAGLTQLEPALDTAHAEEVGPFYAALLGGTLRNGEPIDPSGQVPGLWFQEPSDDGPQLPPSDPEQRWHFDVWVPADAAQARVDAAIAAGGVLVSEAAAPSFWVLADADGNRSCICSVAAR